MAKVIRKPRRKVMAPQKCYFCEEKISPSFKEPQVLERTLTERGKIIGRSRNGFCQRHQRMFSEQVKYARHLALLPFLVRG